MRSRRPASSARTWFVCRRLRFRLVAFLVRMWLRLAWPALYLPEAVFRKRLAAPRCVLILGIAMSLGVFFDWPGRQPWHPSGAATLSILPLPACKSLIQKRIRTGPDNAHTSRQNRAGHYDGSGIALQIIRLGDDPLATPRPFPPGGGELARRTPPEGGTTSSWARSS